MTQHRNRRGARPRCKNHPHNIAAPGKDVCGDCAIMQMKKFNKHGPGYRDEGMEGAEVERFLARVVAEESMPRYLRGAK